jgi:hypothetical protein
MSKLFVDEIVHQSSQGSGTITIGASGETTNIVGTLQNDGAALVTGKILQVVQGTTTYNKVNSSTSFTDVESSSGVTWVTSITPSSSSNKILIIATIGSNNYESSSEGDQRGLVQMLGDINGAGYATLSGQHKTGGYAYGGTAYGVSIGQTTPLNFFWTPNTTSQCNIKFEFKPTGNNGNMSVSGNSGLVCTCNLLEVSQ